VKRARTLLLPIILLTVAALACNFATGGDETPEDSEQPTQAPVVTVPSTDSTTPTDETIAASPTEETATEEPPTEEPPTEVPPTTAPLVPALELASAPYVDELGLFELVPPAGWAETADIGGASFGAPDDSGFINVEITNTGLFLSSADFERFVDARDFNFFGVFDGYEELNRQIDSLGGTAQIAKRLSFDGKPQLVYSAYEQRDAVIMAVDFWADIDLAPTYRESYDAILDTLDFDSAAAFAELDLYAWIYDFVGPNDLFTIQVPMAWRYEISEGEVAIVDTFYSPDEHGIVQNIAYDEGEEISRSDAGAFALDLLRTYYAEDIVINDDQLQADGSERLTWNSPGGDYSGISFLETRGTTFLLFSVLWDNPFEDIYFDALDYTISTYDVPDSE
jgi:hypothetical protein